MKIRVLIVEDEAEHRDPLRDGLISEGFEVETADTAAGGFASARRFRPDAIVLDVLLPDGNGLDLARRLRQDATTRHVPIVVVSAKGGLTAVQPLETGAVAFLPKPFRFDELLAHLRAQVRRQPPFQVPDDEVVVTIHYEQGQQLLLQASGVGAASIRSVNRVDLNPGMYVLAARSALRDPEWRALTKKIGREIYQEIFSRDIVERTRFYTTPGSERNMRLRLQTSRGGLQMPFEMMFDGTIEGGGNYLVLKQPMSRYVTDIDGNRRPVSRDFLNRLATSDEPLRVLLIGSNTDPPIPMVDEEVRALAQLIPREFDSRRVPVEMTVLTTNEASFDAVDAALRECRAHIVHYAGHGVYDPLSPERSQLRFWSGLNRSGVVVPMTGSALAATLVGSDTRFFYLSCCEGATSGSAGAFLGDDFLGVIDALAQAGVPAVLGYRHPVGDASAVRFAEHFYRGLTARGELDLALFDARNRMSANRDDPSWLTPLLVLQQLP
jgi:DNA-binding response OmpR family regulator